MDTKRCTKCTAVKPTTDFIIPSRECARCASCRRDAARVYYAEVLRPRREAERALRVVESLPGEEWREVVPGYMVSSCGRAKSTRFGHKLLAPTITGGYAYIAVPTLKRRIQLHRLVATAFHGEPPQAHECDHIDRNRQNNSAGNLRWVTHKENMANTARSLNKRQRQQAV